MLFNNEINVIQAILWLTTLCCIVLGDQIDSVYSVSTPKQIIRFSFNGDLIDIESNYSYRNITSANETFGNSDNFPLLKLNAWDNRVIDSCIQSARTTFQKNETDTTVSFRFLSSPFLSNIRYVKEYTVNKKNYFMQFSTWFYGDSLKSAFKNTNIQIQLTLNKDTGNSFNRIYIGNKIEKLRADKANSFDTLESSHWSGVHNRFWSLCIQSAGFSLPLSYGNESIAISLPQDISNPCSFRIYSGPVVYHELQKEDRKLTFLLYPLPFWMRWLSFGFLLIFDTLLRVFKNVPMSLLILSVCVKIILAPLFKLASKWQKQVNQQSSRLQPKLDEIKRRYKGEEQTKQTLAAYKELGISPLYSLKSLLSAAIQIPVFFAAYHMLSEHIALSNISFMWISDLSSPDHLFKLPFTIPLFGSYFNLLPFVMTSFTFASSWLHTDSSLSSVLHKKQRINLFWMAALFFFMLYTSPAGMVIYWTMNNILAFLATAFEAALKHRKTELLNLKSDQKITETL